MQHQKNKADNAEARNKADHTQLERQEGNELFVDASQRLDEEDVKENDMTGSAADEWQNTQEENRNKQDIDKAPGEGRGEGDLVTGNNLKGKKVDADPSQEEDRPTKP
ncbi:hypothetical protein [Longitalea arenae]|uniref:hypothetical protein n=1 Tax=Longitalea arenae TaxID=2812558 RepID=UPI0019685649|nr:hypothetical protein [Longitalea arenae]